MSNVRRALGGYISRDAQQKLSRLQLLMDSVRQKWGQSSEFEAPIGPIGRGRRCGCVAGPGDPFGCFGRELRANRTGQGCPAAFSPAFSTRAISVLRKNLPDSRRYRHQHVIMMRPGFAPRVFGPGAPCRPRRRACRRCRGAVREAAGVTKIAGVFSPLRKESRR
jgi:hypothetical protein